MTTNTDAHGAMPELLPCPFCGDSPKVSDRVSTDTATGHVWFIACFCGGYSANAHQHGDTKQSAATAWNRRAAIAGAVPDGLIACLRGGAQCDEDGTNIIMSREACCVAADILERTAASEWQPALPSAVLLLNALWNEKAGEEAIAGALDLCRRLAVLAGTGVPARGSDTPTGQINPD